MAASIFEEIDPAPSDFTNPLYCAAEGGGNPFDVTPFWNSDWETVLIFGRVNLLFYKL